MPSTIRDLLASGADDAQAIAAPGAKPLTYAGLRAQIDETIAALNAGGVGRGDRVAIVLPNGAEMATAFLSIASGASAAPLNPAYRPAEFEFYMSDLGAKALVVEAGSTSPALEVAARLGVPVIRLEPDQGAGRFTLAIDPAPGSAPLRGGPADQGDEALVLHTSGTTSRPKIVPLAQSNLAASARNIGAALRLTASDCGLVVMPLFHIHGLIAGLLSPLSAGGRVLCTPGFDALKFFAWMEAARPTWFTAVPTMLQTIVARAPRNRATIEANPLRFIRSSSSALPPRLMAELEAAFGAPAIEAYGMTEASHQIASNPLPPGERRPGKVGLAAGPEVAIMDAAGRLLGPGQTGEIVIRGDNVTAGYENNSEANAAAFTGGWFRTGDQGAMDEDGYVVITGRLKEIINRGGEKISPREVDEALLAHPAVAQAIAFAVAHDMLGEDVAAAVVLRDGETLSERDLRDFAGERLAAFKAPRRILFLEEIPKGPTGKIQRIGLAQKLGL
jgi:acyl-CoA synthetase (AMP-forming)/AMP-acid ligase II